MPTHKTSIARTVTFDCQSFGSGPHNRLIVKVAASSHTDLDQVDKVWPVLSLPSKMQPGELPMVMMDNQVVS